MPLRLYSLEKSLHALTEVFAASENDEHTSHFSYFERIAIRAGVLKRIEITYELCWKLNRPLAQRKHLFKRCKRNSKETTFPTHGRGPFCLEC